MTSRVLVSFLALSLAPATAWAAQPSLRRAASRRLHQSPALPRTPAVSTVVERSAAPVLSLRGGVASLDAAASALAPGTPDGAFNLLFVVLSAACAALVTVTRERRGAAVDAAPKSVVSLQRRFLSVFWLFKMADWLQGPYFYEVYASKVLGGVPVSAQGVARLFLTGFGSTAVAGAVIGGMLDSLGRKRGSLAFALMYTIGALSTRCNSLPLLLAGRIAGGVGTALLFSAPEAWLVSEHQASGNEGRWLSQTFGLAYQGDAIVAILAGQLAGAVASRRGPTAPFEASVVFLAAASAIVLATWRENFGGEKAAAEAAAPPPPSLEEGEAEAEAEVEAGAALSSAPDPATEPAAEPAVKAHRTRRLLWEAVAEMRRDRKLVLLGGVQALFEGAMYVFVLQWPPALKALIEGGAVPFGKVFSCFMVCCMLGSTTFSWLARKLRAEDLMSGMLGLAFVSMASAATHCGGGLVPLVAAFFAFEGCVGMYFPLIGTLRSKYLPDAYRGVLMNLYAIPLNLLVVAVFLLIGKLGLVGAFTVSATALGGSFASMLALRGLARKEQREADA